ncbi:FAD binding domain-containing protein [Nitratireductor indicus]|uniref:FAD binding domain-containing protein n=1 Tax=Nitratireductor indicus TaxID=721133 RepID=UPI002875F053|nr:xanthine dehydrogenase family protein subunit M [Nitratireductor indicus]MDS1136364.1 xanthine dehydrogenase family protein subunit M [Nitratireductor indicus]
MDYARPTTLEEALELMRSRPWTVLAGGTDFYPALGGGPVKADVLDINSLRELKGISRSDSHIVIGARMSWSELLEAPLPPVFDMLKQAARDVGSVQIQNVGTVAGNLCNASPAADGVPPLLALDAEVTLTSHAGKRHVPLSSFILGNRQTMREADELVTAIRVPMAACEGRSGFVKLGARRYLVISIAMAAARLVLDSGRVRGVAIAVGSCSAVARRLAGLEAVLAGASRDAVPALVAAYGFPELAPIDDVRGTASYRREAAREIVARALAQAAGEGLGGGIAA